jgi:hypothetical protein
VVRLGAGHVSGTRNPTRQRVHRCSHDPLAPQPVAGQLQQDTGCVVFERACEEERIELRAFSTPRDRPAQPLERLDAMIATGPALPAAVPSEELTSGGRIKGEPGGQPGDRRRRAVGQLVGNPPRPGQQAQLHGGTELIARPERRSQPCPIVVCKREERDQILNCDLGRPAVQAGQVGIRQEPHPARQPPEQPAQESPVGHGDRSPPAGRKPAPPPAAVPPAISRDGDGRFSEREADVDQVLYAAGGRVEATSRRWRWRTHQSRLDVAAVIVVVIGQHDPGNVGAVDDRRDRRQPAGAEVWRGRRRGRACFDPDDGPG